MFKTYPNTYSALYRTAQITEDQVYQIFSSFSQAYIRSVRILAFEDYKDATAFIVYDNLAEMIEGLMRGNGLIVNKEKLIVEPSRRSLVVCRFCKEVGHWKSECKTINDQLQCFYCKQMGHIIKHCPNRHQIKSQEEDGQQQQLPQEPPGTEKCISQFVEQLEKQSKEDKVKVESKPQTDAKSKEKIVEELEVKHEQVKLEEPDYNDDNDTTLILSDPRFSEDEGDSDSSESTVS